MKETEKVGLSIIALTVILAVTLLYLSSQYETCDGRETIHATKNSLYVVCEEDELTEVITFEEEYVWRCIQACIREK